MADIDSIFASSKGKAKLAPQPQIVDKEKPRSKKSVGKPTPVTQKKQPPQTASPKKPQTVVDPSLRLSSSKPSTSNPDKPSKKRKKTDEDEERFKDSRGSGPKPIINIIPTANSIGFQKGFLGADTERAAIEGELQIKGGNGGRWGKVTITLRTVETAGGQEVELNSSEVVLHSFSGTRSTGEQQSPSTYLFSIPLPPDTPQCIHTATSSLTHTLTATLYPLDISLPVLSKSQFIHTRRYTSHTYVPDTSPETEVIDEPTRVEVQLPRTTFKAGEAIPLYLTVPVPSRELVTERGIRLRNIRAELVRVVKAKGPASHPKESSSMQPQPSTSHGEEPSTSYVQKQHGLSSSHTLDMRPVLGVPGGGEVIALSGAACRLHPSRPLHIRLVLHPPHDHERQNVTMGDMDASETREPQDDAENACASVSQTTVLHSVAFTVYVHITFIHMSTHTERVSTISMPIVVVPPSAPLPEVEEAIDTAYRKKHDRPPARTTRMDDADVPHYEAGEAGPSYHGSGAPPPFEEREAPPPFFPSSVASTSQHLPTFLESEAEIYVPSVEDPSISPLPPPTELRFEGEGLLFGFSPIEQFDGYTQEHAERSGTPPPTLEMATRDPNVTEFATLTESAAIGALELALENHPDVDSSNLPPPPPPMDDPSDPPPSIDSDFRLPDARVPSPSVHSPPPAFPLPVDSRVETPRTSNRGESHADGHAPPPYAIPDSTHATEDHQIVAHPPPYVG
ncbi:hypothetical protein BXZ70DRAFT_1000326 [Cristinia sonorae]|uniref:Uncharacterized protein n=1 Tax=Cristinia sonorae TaxID=1940300 RepID=A0A8K0XQ31_9AGAR|nr:hypothetical protein BXZ70DRAFT_1000326 [Cristinia sonorae]